ncbi:unnamed protein product [Diamesa serratosioi]
MLKDYSKECSIHGVKYLTERHNSWCVKIFWIIALILSFTSCFYLIIKTYNKWQSNPVIVTFEEKSTPVWKIPFPAVTICPENKYNKHSFKIDDLLHDEFVELSTDHFTKINALYQICNHYPLPVYQLNTDLLANCSNIFNDIAIDFNDTFQTCVWIGFDSYCEKMFHKLLTDEGICWTFNMLDHSELFHNSIDKTLKYPRHGHKSPNWTLQGGYSSYDAEIYPHRVLGSGITVGLNIELRVKSSNIDYACNGPVQGFKVALHTSGEMPQMDHVFYQVPLKQQVLIAVKPEVITTSKGLYSYKPKKRQCYFNGESKLKFFKVYTQSNCELECLTDYTLKECECVKFSQPHNSSTKVCNIDKVKYVNDGFEDECKCLPACTSIEYNAEISQSKYDYTKFHKKMQTLNHSGDYILSTINIYFKESNIISSRRSELYGITEFLANCGGLLGLFMGFSLISLVEVFYFFVFKLSKKKETNVINEENESKVDIIHIAMD